MNNHNLHQLWNICKKMIVARWPDGDTDALCATEKVILDFHKIDKRGQNLRYSRDTNGNQTSRSFPDSVELKNLRDTVDGVYHLLEGCEMDFEYTIEIRDEMENEYRKY